MRILRALSLDVVAGAACGGLLAEHMAQARMRPGWWVALLTAVWSIYTGDHLLDARRSAAPSLTERHDLHRRHARTLTAAMAGAIALGLAAAFTLRPPVRQLGFALSLAVIAYLASAQGLIFSKLPKEPMAGLLYAAGIWGGPIVMAARPRTWLLIAGGLQAMAAVLNLAALGIFETEVDLHQGSRSLALRLGRIPAERGVLFISLLGTSAAMGVAALATPADQIIFAILAVQTAMPAVMLLRSRWFATHERYRSWGDSVFLLGALPRLLG